MNLTNARSNCAVSSFVIQIVLCTCTPYRNQRVELRLCRQRVRQHKENLGWNNTAVQQNTIASVPCDDMKALADSRIQP